MEDRFSQVASLIGDPVRAKIMWALMDKRAYTATELSVYANTSPQNISMHLNKLVKADLLNVESQGRHKYYNYSRPEIADVIEAMASLMPETEIKKGLVNDDKPVRFCRSCYDHLAGKVGVLLTEGLLSRQFIHKADNSFEISADGAIWFDKQGIDVGQLRKQKRAFAKPCLDWSERKHHLAGSLGAAMLNSMLNTGWVRRDAGSRTILVTRKGEEAFFEHFKIDLK
jgi:DNA-binding transcriptional ArsR family regulator